MLWRAHVAVQLAADYFDYLSKYVRYCKWYGDRYQIKWYQMGRLPVSLFNSSWWMAFCARRVTLQMLCFAAGTMVIYRGTMWKS